MMHGFRWYYIASPLSKWGWVAKTVNNPHPPQHLTTLFTGIGAGLAGLLSLAQHRLAGWPLHPGGASRGPDQYRARRLVWDVPSLAC